MAPIDRLGRVARKVGNDDTLTGVLVAVFILLLFAGTIVAMSVYSRQEDLETAILEGRNASRTNGQILTFIQGCTIPEQTEHRHPKIPPDLHHDHSCFSDQRSRARDVVRAAAVEIDCRTRRALKGLPPLADGADCAPHVLVPQEGP